jgi:hypothetical protein
MLIWLSIYYNFNNKLHHVYFAFSQYGIDTDTGANQNHRKQSGLRLKISYDGSLTDVVRSIANKAE